MSDTKSLRVQKLRVRRTPGITDAFTIDDFADGLNLIYGPNASGKTSTANAIEAIIWPKLNSGKQLSAGAQCRLGSSDYTVDLDGAHLDIQTDGVSTEAPQLPAPEFRERYHLSLHDLLVGSGSGDKFAEEIARQSAGGYDFSAAVEDLGYRNRPSAATAELRALDAAGAEAKVARERQAALYEEARSLIALEKMRDAAEPASAREKLLETALRHAKARIAVAAAQQQLNVFSPLHERLNGTEYDKLEGLSQQLAELTTAKDTESERLSTSERDANRTFPDGPPSPELVSALKEDARLLEMREHELAAAQREVSRVAAELNEARRTIGSAVTDERLSTIDGTTFGALADFAQNMERSQAAVAALDAEANRAGDQSAPTDLDQVRAGITTLTHWLEEGAPEPSAIEASAYRKLVKIAVVVVGLLGWATLCLVWHTVAALGAVLLLVLFAFDQKAKPQPPNARGRREADYVKLRLELPTVWATEPVIELIDSLQRRLAEGRFVERCAEWRMEVNRRRHDVIARRQALDAQGAALAERFGIVPDTDARQLAWLADRISRWQDAYRTCRGAVASVATCREQWDTVRSRLSGNLAAFDYAAADSASAADGQVAALITRVARYTSATEVQQDAHRKISRIEESIRRVSDSIDGVLALDAETLLDETELARLCAEHDGFIVARDQLRMAAGELELARAALGERTGENARLFDLPEEAIEEQRVEAAEIAAKYGSLVAEAATLSAKVDAAKRDNHIEKALATVATAEAALDAMRERDFRAMVGELLSRHVQDVSRDEHRPAVFRLARTIFAQVTSGRYRLEFMDGGIGGASAFRAVDERTQRGHALNELSSATRIQLLLAVRIAFVEAQEQGVCLPLFLDETLGTSDEHRSAAIIDTILTLIQNGRQVFYFTAQRDEVAKWISAAQQRSVVSKVIDLAQLRSIGDAIGNTAVSVLPDGILPTIPSHQGHTHDSYGEALAVPAISTRMTDVSGVHLWYLIDNISALEHLLSIGVGTWGELKNLVGSGGMKILADYPNEYTRASAMARIVAVMLEQLQIGRARIIDRATLATSGAVSERKMDEVVELLSRYNGNATQFLDALERKEVAGFQSKKVDELREYLDREGYLITQLPRNPTEIRTAMLIAATDDIDAWVIDKSAVDTLLHSLVRRAGDHTVQIDAAAVSTTTSTAVMEASDLVS